jgi:hypothetical protein
VAVEEPADRGLQPGRQQVDVRVNQVAADITVYVSGHQTGLPGLDLPSPANQLTPRPEAGNTHGNSHRRKSFSADETGLVRSGLITRRADETSQETSWHAPS